MRIRWRGLELPSLIAAERPTLSPTYGKFIAEPFERGFGVTVGNSLRRILLSSLEGSAVTQIKVHGAQHEFSSLPGVIEDVTDIVLNVKSLVVKNHSEQTRVVRIEKNQKGPITGADVRTDDQVEVINKDLVIATLTEDVPFLLEMVVENGRGYVPATEHTPQAQEIGIIPVDAAFSPVVRVRYEVEETRVGQKTNYDKLTIEIWTNGSVSPEMALVEAAKILRKHLNPFVQYSELGALVHSEARAAGINGHRPGDRGQAGHEPGRVGTVGPGHQLPGVGEHHHRSRPGHPHRGAVVGSPQLRRDDDVGGSREARRHRSAAGHADFAGARRALKLAYSSRSARGSGKSNCSPRSVKSTTKAADGRATQPANTENSTFVERNGTTMRHRRKGRKLGRHPSHQRALLRSLATALFLTERDAEDDDNKPKVKGRIITTIEKAKEVRPLVERCITIARRTLSQQEAADQLEPNADRHSDQWRQWRDSDQWREWNRTIAPVVAARRRALRLLGDKQAVKILFDEIAPRFADRQGGYTRVLRLAKPRLGDAGTRAILELVGKNDRVRKKSTKPSFDSDVSEPAPAAAPSPPETTEPAAE